MQLLRSLPTCNVLGIDPNAKCRAPTQPRAIHLLATPPPTPPRPCHQSHYGDPKIGCCSDEESLTLTGVTGDLCPPYCTGTLKNTCPTDVPAGATATPQCALEDQSTGIKNCGLICSPTSIMKDQKAADAQCGTSASCKAIQTAGLCTYDGASNRAQRQSRVLAAPGPRLSASGASWQVTGRCRGQLLKTRLAANSKTHHQ
jgi:hypothetical protein